MRILFLLSYRLELVLRVAEILNLGEMGLGSVWDGCAIFGGCLYLGLLLLHAFAWVFEPLWTLF